MVCKQKINAVNINKVVTMMMMTDIIKRAYKLRGWWGNKQKSTHFLILHTGRQSILIKTEK